MVVFDIRAVIDHRKLKLPRLVQFLGITRILLLKETVLELGLPLDLTYLALADRTRCQRRWCGKQ